jgi:hypothetical protein
MAIHTPRTRRWLAFVPLAAILAPVVTAAVATARSEARGAAPPVPGAFALRFDQPIEIDARSAPIGEGAQKVCIIGVGRGTFHLADDHLTASLHAAVMQHARMDYRVSAAIFDPAGRLLGTAAHTEAVQYIRLGRVPMLLKSIDLDFGVSRAYHQAAYAAVAISDPEVPAVP